MKNKILIAFLSVLILAGCKALSVSYKTVPAEIPLLDSVGTVVIIDAADTHTPGIAITKKREEVVTQIKQDFIYHLPSAIHLNLGNPAVLDTSLSDNEKNLLLRDDATLKKKIFDKHHATMIIIL